VRGRQHGRLWSRGEAAPGCVRQQQLAGHRDLYLHRRISSGICKVVLQLGSRSCSRF
jgi:hypothetical protein